MKNKSKIRSSIKTQSVTTNSKATLFNVQSSENGGTSCKVNFNTTKMFYDGLNKSASIMLDNDETRLLYKILKKHFKKLKNKK